MDDDRAVVERGRREKDAQQELLRDGGVETRSGPLDVLVQADVALQHEDGADAPSGEEHARARDLLDRLAL